LERKPPFARQTFLRKRLRTSRRYQCKICSMLYSANVSAEQGVVLAVIVIALFIFTRFSCTPTHVQSKPSSDFALRHRLTKYVYKSCAHVG